MGSIRSKVPPFADRDREILLSYNLEDSHFGGMWSKFRETDNDCNGFWTVAECYRLIKEPRISMRAPIIENIFFYADGKGDGQLNFQDFCVGIGSFCALSKEEVLQLLFMIVDEDRNGKIEKEELLNFFSFVPAEAGADRTPMFPVNNKNALDKFRGGKWKYLEFDGLAQLCERFPYIAYPVYHVQDCFRSALLGQKFWRVLDKDRMRINPVDRTIYTTKPDGTLLRIEKPGRCTMKEILEYSRRKTAVQGGKRVGVPPREGGLVAGEITKIRDEQISRMPLMNMIRNCRCMYHVPLKPPEDIRVGRRDQHADLEMEGFTLDRPKTGDGESKEFLMPAPWDTGENQFDKESSGEYTDASSDSSDEKPALPPPAPPSAEKAALKDASGLPALQGASGLPALEGLR
mmetsp:Transcript_89479/g.154867  ORF Transcript_89479/g.154867 Transcript_89479/m.154867 type:complete len:404 (-) Transcript_89479:42-1253(-)